MKAFRLKHIRTGLYYIPVRSIRYKGNNVKSNLSKTGKIYYKDCRKHIGSYSDHTLIDFSAPSYMQKLIYVPFRNEDWEIEYL